MMNGEPLPIQHGFPLRVVVPRWYGMASVKLVTEVEAVDEVFRGHFQATPTSTSGRPAARSHASR